MKHCFLCGSIRHLITDDGYIRCRPCVWKAASEAAQVEAAWKWMRRGSRTYAR